MFCSSCLKHPQLYPYYRRKQLDILGPRRTKKPAFLRAYCGLWIWLDAIGQRGGAAYPNRTDDLPLTRRLLYQLS